MGSKFFWSSSIEVSFSLASLLTNLSVVYYQESAYLTQGWYTGLANGCPEWLACKCEVGAHIYQCYSNCGPWAESVRSCNWLPKGWVIDIRVFGKMALLWHSSSWSVELSCETGYFGCVRLAWWVTCGLSCVHRIHDRTVLTERLFTKLSGSLKSADLFLPPSLLLPLPLFLPLFHLFTNHFIFPSIFMTILPVKSSNQLTTPIINFRLTSLRSWIISVNMKSNCTA